MLAQNFKTPADLKITDKEFEALVKVLGMLERGEIKGTPDGFDKNLTFEDGEPTMFYMAATMVSSDCGTACCFRGWAQHIGGPRVFNPSPRISDPAGKLFYPFCGGISLRDPAKGAIVLRNFLTFGEPRWAEVLAE
jgi:hypothetical protein